MGRRDAKDAKATSNRIWQALENKQAATAMRDDDGFTLLSWPLTLTCNYSDCDDEA